jgi:hypothetical protein
VRGLAVNAGGMTLWLEQTELERGQQTELRFRILGQEGQPVRDFDVEHEKRMHVIVARRDLTGFQHLHPELVGDGTWRTTEHSGGRELPRLRRLQDRGTQRDVGG